MASGQYSLSDLVDLDVVQGIIDGFYKTSRIPPSITDVDGNLLLTVGFKRICQQFHRAHPDTLKNCIESDNILTRSNDDKGHAIHRCLNGLVDVSIPIVIEGNHVAYLFVGQFFMDTPPDKEFFRKQAQRYGFDLEDYMAAVDEVPVFPRETIENAIEFLSNLAVLLGEMALANKRMAAFNERLEEKVRQRTQQLRKESEERERTLAEFETMFNNSAAAIIHIKGDRVIHSVNDYFVKASGYTREELIGQKTAIGHGSDEQAQQFGEKYLPALRKGEIVELETEMRQKDGAMRWCSLCGKAVNPPQIEDGVIWVLQDITERKEFESLKEDVDRIMRHDLKVPLNGIIGMSQALLLDSTLSRQQREDIKMIEESGYRMNNQINQSLELYKIETGAYEYMPQKVDLGGSLRKVLSDLSRKAAGSLLRFNVTIDGLPLEESPSFLTKADPMLTHTMLSNLIDNAVEAAPPETSIDISISKDKNQAILRIANQGAVPYEIRESFFEKYVTQGKGGGTGLGTYTALLMARAQGGDISMETDDARGTTITVSLPHSD